MVQMKCENLTWRWKKSLSINLQNTSKTTVIAINIQNIDWGSCLCYPRFYIRSPFQEVSKVISC